MGKSIMSSQLWRVKTFETFNQHFDILFREHCQDENGCLVHIQRRKYGMDAVCKYLKTMTWESFLLDMEGFSA
jgi:hypothetical protein